MFRQYSPQIIFQQNYLILHPLIPLLCELLNHFMFLQWVLVFIRHRYHHISHVPSFESWKLCASTMTPRLTWEIWLFVEVLSRNEKIVQFAKKMSESKKVWQKMVQIRKNENKNLMKKIKTKFYWIKESLTEDGTDEKKRKRESNEEN